MTASREPLSRDDGQDFARASPREPQLILQSYLDAVMLGFLLEHGEDGLQRFSRDTGDFEIGLHLDRDVPVYPKAIRLDSAHASLFDRLPAESING